MPTGDLPGRTLPRRGARGFTYVALLLATAIGGAAAGVWASRWHTLAQREHEAELLFRGQQLRQALQHYAAATPAGAPRRPLQLDELLADGRSGVQVHHHLRRLWTDPFTRQADWVALRDAQGRITGVRSRASQAALRRSGLPAGVRLDPAAQPQAPRVADWQFVADTPGGIAAARTPVPADRRPSQRRPP